MAQFDLRALRYFVAVAEAGSYSEAALQLEISQPAVSRQIALLEGSVKRRLFRREGRRYVLSDAGLALYKQAQKIMDEVRVLEDLVTGADQQPGGKLALGVPVAVGDYVMPGVLAGYCERYPNIALHLYQNDSTILAQMTSTGRLDLALVYGMPSLPELELRQMADVQLGVVAPVGASGRRLSPLLDGRSEVLTLRQVAGLPLILPGKGAELRRVIESALVGQRLSANVIMEVDGTGLAKALVAAGLGCTVIASHGAAAEVQRKTLQFIPIERPRITWALSAAMRKSRQTTPATEAMITEISRVMGADGQLRA